MHFLYLCVGIVIHFLWMCFEIIWFKETRMLAGKLQYFYFVVNLFTFQLISSCHISWHALVFTKSLLLDEKRRRCCACDFSTAWFARNLIAFFSAPAIDCASVQGTTHQFDVSELEQVKSLMIMIFPWFETMDSGKQCFTFGGVAKEFPLWGKGCGDSPSKLQVSSSVSCSAT